jgi:hypothetical protein
MVTDSEFALRTARELLPGYPAKALVFVNRVLTGTVDPRLRFLVEPILSMIEQNDLDAARRWLDRALTYEQIRRPPY